MQKVFRTIDKIRNYDLSGEHKEKNRATLAVNFFKSYLAYHEIENEGAVFALASMFGDELFQILSNTEVKEDTVGEHLDYVIMYSKKENDDKLVVAPTDVNCSLVISNHIPYDMTTSINLNEYANNKCRVIIEGIIPSINADVKYLQRHVLTMDFDENGLIEGYKCITDGKHITLADGTPCIIEREVTRDEDKKGYSVENAKWFKKNSFGKWHRYADQNPYLKTSFRCDDFIASPLTMPIEDALSYTNRVHFGYTKGISNHLTEHLSGQLPNLAENLRDLNESQNIGSR